MKSLVLFAALAIPFVLSAQPKPAAKDAPVVQYSTPLFVVPIAKVKVILRGQKLDAVTEVKSADAKVTAKLVGKARKAAVPNNYPANKLGDTEVEVELDFKKDHAPDSVALTAVGPGGTSEVYQLLVVTKPVLEQEPNDNFAQAQAIALPVTLEGTIAKERDVDVYKFEGKQGQRVKFSIVAAKLGAPTDALLTLYDDAKGVLAIVDDTGGSPDPILEAKLPRDGTYYVVVIEASDLGGAQFGYRLKAE